LTPIQKSALEVLAAYDQNKDLSKYMDKLRRSIGDTRHVTKDQRSLMAALKNGPVCFGDLDLAMDRRSSIKAMDSLISRRLIHIVSFVVGFGPCSRVLALGPRPNGHKATASKNKYLITIPQEIKIDRSKKPAVLKNENKPSVVIPRRDIAASWI
jgi:hypothetical protein